MIVLDDVAGRSFLDVDALVAARVECVVVNPVRIRAIDRTVRNAPAPQLLGSCSDIDALSVFPSVLVDEIIDTSVLDR